MKKCKVRLNNTNLYFWKKDSFGCYLFTANTHVTHIFNSIKAAKEFIKEHYKLCKEHPEKFSITSYEKLVVEVI